MAIRNVFGRFIEDENDLEDFGKWAFGENYRELYHTLGFMKAWNMLHGEKYKIKPDSVIEHDIPKMVELWRDSL